MQSPKQKNKVQNQNEKNIKMIQYTMKNFVCKDQVISKWINVPY